MCLKFPFSHYTILPTPNTAWHKFCSVFLNIVKRGKGVETHNSPNSSFADNFFPWLWLTKCLQTAMWKKNLFKFEARKQPKKLIKFHQNLYALLFAEYIIIYFIFFSCSYSSINSLSNIDHSEWFCMISFWKYV